MWALGDYHKFATEVIWGFGAELVAACGISAGQRVLDVAAGSGNVAIRAAEAGAQVVASDLTPENFEAGRREARAPGGGLARGGGDAEAPPLPHRPVRVGPSAGRAVFPPPHPTGPPRAVRRCP